MASDRPKMTKQEKKAHYRTDYPEPIKSRREVLKKIMMHDSQLVDREAKARATFTDYFDQDFHYEENIFEMVVNMVKAMPDRGKTAGQNLATWYLEEFSRWLKADPIREENAVEKFLNATVQLRALENCDHTQKTLVSEVFRISPKRLLEDVKKLLGEAIQKKEFAKAAELAIQHELVTDYSFDELALPLILCGKDQLAFKLMSIDPRFQRTYVRFLDQFVGESLYDVERILQPYKDRNMMTLPFERFFGKSVEKCLNTFFNKHSNEYGFESSLQEHASKHGENAPVKAMKYNITERYDNGASDEMYFQHMKGSLMTSSAAVRENIFHFLWSSNNREKQIDVISWAIHFRLNSPNANIPGKMKDFFKAPDERYQEAEELLRARLQKCAQGQQGDVLYVYEEKRKYPIKVIEDRASFIKFCSELEQLHEKPEPVLVGYDSEGKPDHLRVHGTTKIALMQLFFGGTAWIIDCVKLEQPDKQMDDELWIRFSRALFSSNIKVVGFDLRNDLDALLTIPALRDVLKTEQIMNTWCLKRLTENVCDMDMAILELPKKTFKLADLTDRLIGVQLDKSEQCSNWQYRPLRNKQIVYAATDAVVVVEVFEKVVQMVVESDPQADVDKLWRDANVMAPKKERSKKEARKLKSYSWSEIYETLRHHRDESKPLLKPYELKVIVDTMLLGFGKNLRHVGIDVIVPKDIGEFRDKLKLMVRAERELQRHIITVPSKSYDALRREYGRHTIALPDLGNKSAVDQLADFFDHFNIDIRPDGQFHRCTACNSRLLVKFPGPVINFLHQYCVIHVQNVNRPDMNQFPLEYWWNEMLRIRHEDYGVDLKMDRPSPDSDWIVATVPMGCLHITRNTVIHNNLPCGVEVRIHKVPDDEFQRPGLCFYVCGECGTIGYDGRPQTD